MLRYALPLIFSAPMAFAECPTKADLTAGIEFTLDDGGTELHRVNRPDWVQVLAKFPNEETTLLDSYLGLYLFSSVPVVNNLPKLTDIFMYSNDADIAKWPYPAAGKTWTNPTETGGTAVAGDEKQFTLSDCTYTIFDISLTFAEDTTYTETFRYFPDLGTSLLVATKDDQGTERYQYVGIKAVGK
ncbi:MAG: hypothetical protein AB3N17_03215 [Tateyamaria sp.]